MSDPNFSPNSSVGARPIAGPAKKRPAWLLVLLGLLILLVLVVLLVLLSRCGGDDDSTSATPISSTTTAAPPSASADPMASATMSGAPVPSASDGASAGASSAAATTAGGDIADGAGTITTGQANGQGTLLPLANATEIGANGNLSAYTSTKATATSVRVQSVPADEGFWVGSGDSDRVWVQLTGGSGESPFTVKKGDAVSFTGKVVKNTAGYAKSAGVADDEGRAMLTAQGQHLTVARSALTLSK